ncbi:DUF6894 family protein [Sphingomonas sp. MS122]|uniref:DUF6894 family protein n=1 Tax=Sphingomonas sp. MS122 TaxID=3412683 RepID=UPI003C2BCF70
MSAQGVDAGQILKDQAASFWDRDDWRIEVTNADGLVLFSITIFATVAAAATSR